MSIASTAAAGSLRRERVWWLLSHAVLLLVCAGAYASTLLPGVGYSGDATKFQFVGSVLGTAHATGYPTFTLVLALFQLLVPFGSLAYRANLLAALLASGAAQVFLLLFRSLNVRPVPALSFALMVALDGNFWSQAIVAEVYGLHALFLGLTLYFLSEWLSRGASWIFVVACLVYSISFGNNMTTVLVMPVFAVLVLLVGVRRVLRPGVVVSVFVCVCVGAAQYGYLFWATANPETPYLESSVSTLRELWGVASGAQFKGRFFGVPWRVFWGDRLPMVLRILWLTFGPAFALVGVGIFLLRRHRMGIGLLLVSFCQAVFSMAYDIPDVAPYFIPLQWCCAAFGAVGATVLVERIHWRRVSGPIVMSALLLSWPLLSLVRNYHQVDRSRDTTFANGIRAVLRQAGTDAVLVSPDYETSEGLWYFLLGEGEGAARRLSVLHHVDARELSSYVRGEQALWLPEERRAVAPGRSVLAIGRTWETSLRAEGLVLVPAAGPLFRVADCAAEGGPCVERDAR